MANEEITVTDPLGNKIFLSKDAGLISTENGEHEVYDDMATVIQKPALLVEANKDEKKQLYYFRSIGWQHTLLVLVEFNNGRWEIVSYSKNPSNSHLSEILKKGRQLL